MGGPGEEWSLKGNLNKLDAPKGKHPSNMLSLGRVLMKAPKAAAPTQNMGLHVQRRAEEPSVRPASAPVFSTGAAGVYSRWGSAAQYLKSKEVKEQ